MNYPDSIRIVEVGPRDGLQNESGMPGSDLKVALIERLADCGLRHIEAGAFVSPRRVPQMADTAEVLRRIKRHPGVCYSALVPNEQGLQAALAAGVDEIAVFAAASETFSQKNTQCSIADALHRYETILSQAREASLRVRGYVSCVLGCPYEGEVSIPAVHAVVRALHDMGCAEISLGDTIGTGTPGKVRRLIDELARDVPLAHLAGHFHDTYGMAIANIIAALDAGITIFDSALGGLGGCPYAPGASGNVATEDVVWLMQGLDIATGVDLESLVETSAWFSGQLGRLPASRVSQALLARKHPRTCAAPLA